MPQLLAPGSTARVETGLNTFLTYGSADLEPGSCLLDYRRCEFTDARPSMILARLAMTVSNEGRRAQPPTLRPLVSVQAVVNYYNAGHKVLTRMFAVEDSHWCASMIPGIEATGIPLPLGGTSNHLRSAQLSELDGWDPWNVNEGADLGATRQYAWIPNGVHRLDHVGASLFQGLSVDQAAGRVGQRLYDDGRREYASSPGVCAAHLSRGAVGMIGLIARTPLTNLSYSLVRGFTIITSVGVCLIGVQCRAGLLALGWATMLLGNAG